MKMTETTRGRTFTLELSEDEAETLLALSAKVGGDPARSRRGTFEELEQALTKALGHTWRESPAWPETYKEQGIRFANRGTVAPR